MEEEKRKKVETGEIGPSRSLDSIRPQLLHHPHHTDTKRQHPRAHAHEQHAGQGLLVGTDARVIGTGGGDLLDGRVVVGAAGGDDGVVLVVAGPAVVEEGVEGEGEVGGGEDDEEEVEEEEEGFGGDGAETEAEFGVSTSLLFFRLFVPLEWVMGIKG